MCCGRPAEPHATSVGRDLVPVSHLVGMRTPNPRVTTREHPPPHSSSLGKLLVIAKPSYRARPAAPLRRPWRPASRRPPLDSSRLDARPSSRRRPPSAISTGRHRPSHPVVCCAARPRRSLGSRATGASSTRLPPQRMRVTRSPSQLSSTLAANGWASRAATCASSSLHRRSLTRRSCRAAGPPRRSRPPTPKVHMGLRAYRRRLRARARRRAPAARGLALLDECE